MRVLVCPQEFRGSLTAEEAASAIARGARRALDRSGVASRVIEQPIADGGPGTLSVLTAAAGAARVLRVHVTGPLGDPVGARLALLPGSAGTPVAVIESAEACGLGRVPEGRRDPGRATTRGVGELVARALAEGAREIVVGVGGTATNDGGAGAARVLGLALRDAAGAPLAEGGEALAGLARIERAQGASSPEALGGATLRIAVDVANPLLGPQGAIAVYGPQKGVEAALAGRLEAGLERWAARCREDQGVDLSEVEGAGAGGGLPVGLLTAASAGGAGGQIESGAAFVGEAIGFDAAARRADLIITGEGRLDEQSAFGKATRYAADVAAAAGRPCLAVCGEVASRPAGVLDAEGAGAGRPAEEAMRRADELVTLAADRLLTRFLAAGTAS